MGATTKPLPSSTFWQLDATPRTFTTLGRVVPTTAEVASAASGAATEATGVGPNCFNTSCRPEVSHSPESRPGTVRNQEGATESTSAITLEPCTAATRLGCGEDTSAVPSSQAAVSTRTSCTATPTTESTTRSVGLRIAPRTARPSTTPAISPITTSARIMNSVTNSLVRGPSMWLTTCGASSTPATAPSTTPTRASREPGAPDRQPETGGDERYGENGYVQPL